jgi:hypothetical protein
LSKITCVRITIVLVKRRTLIRLDAAFELALGALLIVSWPLGWFELASWEGWPAAALGALLLGVGLALWLAPADPSTLKLVAIANAAGAALFAGWLLLWRADFDAAGAALVVVTAAVLGALAAAEWSAARSEIAPDAASG